MSRIHNFYRGEAHVDFARRWRIGAIVSTVLVLVSIGSFLINGLNLGIEFDGGTSWEYRSDQSVAEVRDVLEPFGLETAKIQSVGRGNVRIQADTSDPDTVKDVTAALAESADVPVAEISTNVIGPTWGETITEKAIRALVIFFIVIAIYMALRLEWRMAVGALVAVTHDIIITVGVYSIFQFEVTPATVVAILTILGYSLYDTVVVFDRARENGARFASTGRLNYTDVMALSVNQVLVRSISTTIVTLLPVVIMLVVGTVALGAAPLREFAVALMVGLLVGAYSSLFVAAPIVVWLKERETRWRQIRQRLETRAAAGGVPAEVPVGAVVGVAATTTSGAGPAASAPTAAAWSGAHPPRPRKGRGKTKRR
jgi:preprotein translocase subunit SecF